MNFSELFKQSSKQASYSPNGNYIGNACQFRLIIREVKSLQVIRMFNCVDTIQEAEWSPDSLFILCVLKKRGLVQVSEILSRYKIFFLKNSSCFFYVQYWLKLHNFSLIYHHCFCIRNETVYLYISICYCFLACITQVTCFDF